MESKLNTLVSVQLSSATQSCQTLCDPLNHSAPGLPVHHQLLESTQTHVHWVGDATQPSHPLLSPSPPAPNPLVLFPLIHLQLYEEDTFILSVFYEMYFNGYMIFDVMHLY